MADKTNRLPVIEQTQTAMLPPLYGKWVEGVLSWPPPEERHATCLDCAMCKPRGQAATASVMLYDREAKCCSYLPSLPNFLVGSILDDQGQDADSGRSSLERRIRSGVGVTPLGLQAPPDIALLQRYTSAGLFGRTEAFRCPHYLAVGPGLCSIWSHRNAVCATYFCKFEHGAIGRAFWDAMRQLLTTTERYLSLWCATELGEVPETLGPALLTSYVMLPAELRNMSTKELRQQFESTAWGPDWVGRKREFYVEAARLVESLSWAQVVEVGGPEVALQIHLLRDAQAELQLRGLPEYLRLAAINVTVGDGGKSFVSGYSATDMLILSNVLVNALFHFDGRCRTSEVLQQLAAETNVSVEAETIRRLCDFGVLVPMTPFRGNDVACKEPAGLVPSKSRDKLALNRE